MTRIAVLCALAAASALSHAPKGDPHLDGRVLQGYEAAVAYLRLDGEMTKAPFVLSNYGVTFEKGYRYRFEPKRGPNYKPWPGLSTDLGTTVRVYVDEKTLIVQKAVVE